MLEVYRRLYPDTGYAYDSRGSAEDLRTDIDIEKVSFCSYTLKNIIYICISEYLLNYE